MDPVQLLEDDIRFTKYRLTFRLNAATRQALEHRLAGLEADLKAATMRKAA